MLLGFFGLFVILTYGLRAVTLVGVYAVVPAEMPVVQAAVDDPSFHRFREETRDSLTPRTPAVVLTTEAFYFGDLDSFTVNFADNRNKFILPHVDGEPQLAGLVETMSGWVADRSANDNVAIDKVLVFIPEGEIPMPIVIQVIAGLRRSPYFDRVILAGGLM